MTISSLHSITMTREVKLVAKEILLALYLRLSHSYLLKTILLPIQNITLSQVRRKSSKRRTRQYLLEKETQWTLSPFTQSMVINQELIITSINNKSMTLKRQILNTSSLRWTSMRQQLSLTFQTSSRISSHSFKIHFKVPLIRTLVLRSIRQHPYLISQVNSKSRNQLAQ